MKKVNGYGPAQADVVIVGDFPGEDSELKGQPFVGAPGQLLTTLLREAGIRRDECYLTNVCKYRPPGNDISKWITDKKKTGIANEWVERGGRYMSPEVEEGLGELFSEVYARKPKVVIGLGNVALWAFSHEWGITAWRGSEMYIPYRDDAGTQELVFIPTIHPAAILRQWQNRAFVSRDLQRVRKALTGRSIEPQWEFNYVPSLRDATEFLEEVELCGEAAVDVETSRGQIVCIGIATSPTKAMCIPFISEGYGAYWGADDLRKVKAAVFGTLSRIAIIGQNFNYDADYFLDNFGARFRVEHDTKIAANVLFPGLPANLGHLSSMHCDWHCYWKDDARDWTNLRDFDSLFRYNCRDVCATFEVAQKQKAMLQSARLQAQFADRMCYCHYVFDMQQRGVIRDTTRTQELDAEIDEACATLAQTVATEAGAVVNIGSPKQVSDLLYKNLGLRRPAKYSERKSGEASANGPTGSEELKQVIKWHPERTVLLEAISQWRALRSAQNNFLHAPLDPDGILRSGFSTTGAETFRLTSGTNNFYRGTNLLNVSGNGFTHSGNKLPNLRKAIVPPSGYTLFDCDLARADLQVVVWESNDADLKQKLHEGLDIHLENAKDIFGISADKQQRELAKKFVHLTNYGGRARTCAIQLGITVHEADMGQRRWFSAHPSILEWHKRVEAQLKSTRTVTNKFGYRRVYFERVDDAMWREALAWVPQSTIALVASYVHMQMEEAGAQVLIQMYDSVMGMFPTVESAIMLPKLYEATKVTVPYEGDPLVIPMGIKLGTESWGECAEHKWDELLASDLSVADACIP